MLLVEHPLSLPGDGRRRRARNENHPDEPSFPRAEGGDERPFDAHLNEAIRQRAEALGVGRTPPTREHEKGQREQRRCGEDAPAELRRPIEPSEQREPRGPRGMGRNPRAKPRRQPGLVRSRRGGGLSTTFKLEQPLVRRLAYPQHHGRDGERTRHAGRSFLGPADVAVEVCTVGQRHALAVGGVSSLCAPRAGEREVAEGGDLEAPEPVSGGRGRRVCVPRQPGRTPTTTLDALVGDSAVDPRPLLRGFSRRSPRASCANLCATRSRW